MHEIKSDTSLKVVSASVQQTHAKWWKREIYSFSSLIQGDDKKEVAFKLSIKK